VGAWLPPVWVPFLKPIIWWDLALIYICLQAAPLILELLSLERNHDFRRVNSTGR